MTAAESPRTTYRCGPVEVALTEQLRRASSVQTSVRRSGERFVVAPAPRDTTEARKLVEELARLDAVADVTTDGRQVFLKPTAAFLARRVLGAVLAAGSRYGWSSATMLPPYIVSIGCPNANKPLHIGHLRNCFFGVAVSHLLQTAGHEVLHTEEISNYGIHICQALVAYIRYAEGLTPADVGERGDHFVGRYYVRFHLENSMLDADEGGVTELEHEATALLRRMEAGDPDAMALNERFTEWAIEGFRQTYARVGLEHDFVLRELEALPVAQALIEKGLVSGACQVRDDGSVFIDLGLELGEATLRRGDGSPLALAQFVAIWVRRAQLHPRHRVVRVTGEHWRLSFSQFLEVLKRLGAESVSAGTEAIYYGMIRTDVGKIRSRTGNDVGADALIDGLRDRLIEQWADARGRAPEPVHREACERYAVAALKYYVLDKKRTNDFVYSDDEIWTSVIPRLDAVLRVFTRADETAGSGPAEIAGCPVEVLQLLDGYPGILDQALERRSTSNLVHYLDRLVHKAWVADRRGEMDAGTWRAVAVVARGALWVLGIDPPAVGRELPPPPAVRREEALVGAGRRSANST